MTFNGFRVVLVRELWTVLRSRANVVLLLGVAAITFGMTLVAGGASTGYLPAIVDLLLPFELLVPAVAIAVGYRSIVDDVRRGEHEVLRTYPLSTVEYVLGVYLGRAAALIAIFGIPLSLLGLYVAFTASPDTAVIATHRGIDSPILYGRFLFLTIGFSFVVLAIALALSAVSASRRTAIVLAVIGVGVVVIGVDLLVLRSFAADRIAADSLLNALALSPTSAYRGLVFETVLYAAMDAQTRFAAPIASVAGLVAWTVVSLGIAVVSLVRRN